MKTKKLYRPVGIKELELIMESDFKAFPPRLEWQPIFYPVLNQQYAEQIARDWNTTDEFSGFVGMVTSFDLTEDYLSQYEVHNVGSFGHDELWVPAKKLNEFNEHLIGEIKLETAFFGKEFSMPENNELRRILKDLK